ncbi:MAG: RNA methyltransferase [Clostridiales bacterium]|nr:RNA methyltransferase [Clostridiales bacterium]
MEVIISEDNKLIKRANKLKDKKYRDQSGEYLIEGLRGIIDTPDEFIKVILTVEGFSDSRLNDKKIVYITEKLMNRLSMTDISSGVIAIAAQKQESDFVSDYIIYLDRIRDPGNMGTIIRTAVAAGYEIVCDDCVDVYNPKVVRSCVSALSKARVHNGNFIDILAEKGYNIIGAEMGGKNIFESAKPNKLCIVIGNEANGIRKDILDKCNMICSIPMENMESLNASVCAGILMYYFKY